MLRDITLLFTLRNSLFLLFVFIYNLYTVFCTESVLVNTRNTMLVSRQHLEMSQFSKIFFSYAHDIKHCDIQKAAEWKKARAGILSKKEYLWSLQFYLSLIICKFQKTFCLLSFKYLKLVYCECYERWRMKVSSALEWLSHLKWQMKKQRVEICTFSNIQVESCYNWKPNKCKVHFVR